MPDPRDIQILIGAKDSASDVMNEVANTAAEMFNRMDAGASVLEDIAGQFQGLGPIVKKFTGQLGKVEGLFNRYLGYAQFIVSAAKELSGLNAAQEEFNRQLERTIELEKERIKVVSKRERELVREESGDGSARDRLKAAEAALERTRKNIAGNVRPRSQADEFTEGVGSLHLGGGVTYGMASKTIAGWLGATTDDGSEERRKAELKRLSDLEKEQIKQVTQLRKRAEKERIRESEQGYQQLSRIVQDIEKEQQAARDKAAEKAKKQQEEAAKQAEIAERNRMRSVTETSRVRGKKLQSAMKNLERAQNQLSTIQDREPSGDVNAELTSRSNRFLRSRTATADPTLKENVKQTKLQEEIKDLMGQQNELLKELGIPNGAIIPVGF